MADEPTSSMPIMGEPLKLQDLLRYRATMIWDGYIYQRERIGKNRSWWRCRRNRPRDKEARMCMGRAVYRNQKLAVTVEHSHGPETTSQNFIPSHCRQSGKKDSVKAAVKGFVLATDQDLLQSKVTDVVKHHQCDLCGMKFAIGRVLETHKMLEHQVCALWKCGECGMQFLQSESHSRHMRLSHPSPGGQPDCVSGAVEDDAKGQTEQVMNTEEEKEKMEPQTDQEENILQLMVNGEEEKIESKSGVMVKSEILTRKERILHKCDFCSAEFRHPCKLKIHIRQHTGERPYKCSLCPKTFTCGSRRGAHFKSAHAKVRKHLCDWCGKKFTKLEVLNEHVRTHTGEKPFSCEICSRQFRKRNAMTVHIRQHTGEKPYVCDQCGQSFTVKVSLRAHLKSKHNIIVKTDVPERDVQSGDSSIPSIGRPKKSDAEKQLFGNRENGDLERKGAHVKVNNVNASSSGILDCSVFPLTMSDCDVISSGAFCSVPQF